MYNIQSMSGALAMSKVSIGSQKLEPRPTFIYFFFLLILIHLIFFVEISILFFSKNLIFSTENTYEKFSKSIWNIYWHSLEEIQAKKKREANKVNLNENMWAKNAKNKNKSECTHLIWQLFYLSRCFLTG